MSVAPTAPVPAVPQEPKRHHYIPEFFLRRWCTGGKLTRYVRTRKGVYCKQFAPKAVAFRTDLYKLRGIGIADPQGLETNVFAKLDNDTSLVIAKLLAAQPYATTPEEQELLALFLLALPARNPWAIDHGEDIARKAHAEALNADPNDAAALGLRPGTPVFEQLSKLNPYWMADRTRQILIDVWSDPDKVRRLLEMNWTLRVITDSPVDLVLGDRPLIRHGELMGTRCVLALPLSPKVIVFASNIEGLENSLGPMSDADLVTRANLDSTAQAKEHIFATGRQHRELAERRLNNDIPFPALEPDQAASDSL